jgi:hypothetical protein
MRSIFPNQHFKTIKNKVGDIEIDLTENYGRIVKLETESFEVIAAPIIYFGDPFFKYISTEKILAFPFADKLELNYDTNLIKINLCGLETYQSQNRKKQELFWSYFEINKLINEFRFKKIPLDEVLQKEKLVREYYKRHNKKYKIK